MNTHSGTSQPSCRRTMAGLSRRRLVAGVVLGSAAALAAPHVARAAARTVRFAHNNTDQSHFGRGATVFAEQVAADPVLSGVLRFEIYGNGQLGDDLATLSSLMKGTLDGGLVASSIISNVVPDVGLLNAPYVFKDVGQARAVIDGPVGAGYREISRAKGLPVLAWGENGLRHITSNQAVRRVADLQGLKLRVPQSPVMLNGFRAMGADAAPLAYGLLRDALRSGEFQAQENAITLIEAAKLYEVQTYLCLTGHIYDAVGFLVAPDLLEDLTEAQQAALAACARQGAAMTRQVSDAAAADGIGRLRAAGMTIVDDVDLSGFRAAARPFLEGLSSTYGPKQVASLLEAGS